MKERRIIFDAILVVLALGLAVLEMLLPIQLLIPIPGIKLGLANIVLLFAIIELKPKDVFLIVIVRTLILPVFSGPLSAVFSFSGSILACLVMLFLHKFQVKNVSLWGLSMAGAAFHNLGQIVAATILMKEPLFLTTYLPILLFASLIMGSITALIARPLFSQVKKYNLC